MGVRVKAVTERKITVTFSVTKHQIKNRGEIMNNFYYKIIRGFSPENAEAALNNFIVTTNNEGVKKILEIKDHVITVEDVLLFIFIIKVQN